MWLIKFERLFLYATIIAIMLPLNTQFGFIGIALFNIPMCALYGLWVLRTMSTGRLGLGIHRWELLWLMLGLWMVMATLYNGFTPRQAADLVRWESAIGLAIYARRNYKVTFDFSALLRIAVVALLVQAVFALLQFVLQSRIGMVSAYFGEQTSTEGLYGEDTLQTGSARVVGTLGQPNLLGNWVNMMLPFVYVMFSGRIKMRQWSRETGYFILWIVGVLITVLAISRWNVFVALLIPVVLGLTWRLSGRRRLLKRRWSRRALRWVAIGMVVVVSFIVAGEFITSSAGQTFLVMEARLESSNSAADFRLRHMGYAFVWMTKHPIFGSGFSNSGTIWTELDANMPAFWFHRVHNIFLLYGAEGGFPAAIFFLLIVFGPVVRYFRNIRLMTVREDAMAASLFAYLLSAQLYLLPAGHALWPLFAFLIGTFHAAVPIAIREAKAKAAPPAFTSPLHDTAPAPYLV